MMTTAHRNAFAVQDRGQIMGVDADRLEGDDWPLIPSLADDSDAVQLFETPRRGARQRHLMRSAALAPDAVEIIERGRQSDCLHDGRRARLEAHRRIGVSDIRACYFAD